MKVRKIKDKELVKVTGQCCCQIVGKSAVYEQGSCCLSDCKTSGKDTAYHTIYH